MQGMLHEKKMKEGTEEEGGGGGEGGDDDVQGERTTMGERTDEEKTYFL